MNAKYWENRYKKGGDSGLGSYGLYCDYKSDYINRFLEKHKSIKSIVDFGCGDGNQISFFNLEGIRYLGIDVSNFIVNELNEKYTNDAEKSFITYDEYIIENFDLSISIDVIYHITDDITYYHYMDTLFSSSSKYIIIYSTNNVDSVSENITHIKHREFLNDIPKNFSLISKIEGPSGISTKFFVFEKIKN